MRRSHRNAASALVLVPILCIASVVVSCRTNENTTQTAVNSASHVEVVEDFFYDARPLVQVPDVIGLSGDEAYARLEDAGFSVEFDAYDISTNGVHLDTVTGMDPIAGTQAQPGSMIVLSIFAEPVLVPDVIGLSADEAFALLEAARFRVGAGLHDIPETGVQHDTVTGMDPIAGTSVPFGSAVMLSIYMDNQPDSPAMDAEDWDRARIAQELEAEFGDRRGRSHWDETTATLNFQIADLSTDDIDSLQSRYADEAFTVTFSNATVSRGELQTLNNSTKPLVSAFHTECQFAASGAGIHVESWSIVVNFSPDYPKGQSVNDCIQAMREAILANAADFAAKHSIRADPTDLVQLREVPYQAPGDVFHD